MENSEAFQVLNVSFENKFASDFRHEFSPSVRASIFVICNWCSDNYAACAVGHNVVLPAWKTMQGELKDLTAMNHDISI
jgi:hypothetical protein